MGQTATHNENTSRDTGEAIKRETVCCDLCGSARSETVMVGWDMLYGAPGQWPVVRCLDCGLVYTNPRPAPE